VAIKLADVKSIENTAPSRVLSRRFYEAGIRFVIPLRFKRDAKILNARRHLEVARLFAHTHTHTHICVYVCIQGVPF